MNALTVLYRGPLASCNYACAYCPFAKRVDARAALAADREALERFVSWVAARAPAPTAVFFTPWGEALTRRWYPRALVELTSLAHVTRAAVQTNLSGTLGWVAQCDRTRLALWTTYHPSEVSRARFLARCAELLARGVRFSVGVVGLREHFDELRALRAALPSEVYLWVNAYRRVPDYYSADDVRMLEAIDPLFQLNTRAYPSRGRACNAGHTVIAVDGDGTARRCHFIPEPLGNIYADGFESALAPRPCTAEHCRCHIGYVHSHALGLDEVFRDGLLERIPHDWPAAPHDALVALGRRALGRALSLSAREGV